MFGFCALHAYDSVFGLRSLMPSGVLSASGSSTLCGKANDYSEMSKETSYKRTKSPGLLQDNMIIPREYDTPESGSSADTFEFPPDIPDGITFGDLASHISNVVEDIHLHAPSKVEQRPHDTDQLCLKADDRPFDPPKIDSFDSNPFTSTIDENCDLLQHVFCKHRTMGRRSLSDSKSSGISKRGSLKQTCHNQSLRHYHSLSCLSLGALHQYSCLTDPMSPCMCGHSNNHMAADRRNHFVNTVIDNRAIPACFLQSHSPNHPAESTRVSDNNLEDDLSTPHTTSGQNQIRDEEPLEEHNSSLSDGDDEFGDFATFSSELAPKPEQPSADCVNTCEPGDDCFADFSSCSGQPTASSLEVHSSFSSRSLVGSLLAHLGSALEQAFNVDSEANIEEFSNTTPVDSSPPHFWDYNSECPPNRLWRTLIDHPGSLVYVWKESFTYSRYLQTVGVDLRSSRFLLPLSGGLLEPTPVTPTVNKTSSGGSASPTSSSSSQYLQAATAPSPSPRHEQSTLATTAQSAQGPPHVSAPIPEFDWSASGLTNPLTETTEQAGSIDLDLEYIEEISTKLPASKQQASISELEVEFLTEPPPPPLLPPPLPTPSVLRAPPEQPCTRAIDTEPDDSLRFSVEDVLSHLPNFSYVRKSTLMFPVLEVTDIP